MKPTTKLMALHPDHERRMAEWADLWIRRGLSCEPAEWASWEEGARRCYQFAGLPWPSVVVRVASPLVLAFAAPIAASFFAREGAVREAVGGAVRGAVGGAVRGAVREAVEGSWYNYLGGCFWLSWQAYTSFFRDVCGLTLPRDTWERDAAYAQAQQSAGWWWPHCGFVMVSDRPVVIRREQIGPAGWNSHRLHAEDGAAIAWRDGWKLYFLHGVRVPAALVETRTEDLDPRRWVAQEPNAEIRREAVRKIGIERVCQQLGATTLQRGTDHVGQPCELLLLDLGDGRRRPYIKLIHPGVGTYHIEGVHPDCATLDEAFTFRNQSKGAPLWLK